MKKEKKDVLHWYVDDLYSTACGFPYRFGNAATVEEVSCLRCRHILKVKGLLQRSATWCRTEQGERDEARRAVEK